MLKPTFPLSREAPMIATALGLKNASSIVPSLSIVGFLVSGKPMG
jgi:hypothetical protein